jgi:hypothetical protein
MQETSIEKLRERSSDILIGANSMKAIVDEKGLEIASGLISGIKGIRKDIADFFRPNIDRLNQAHREAIRQMKNFDDPLAEGERQVKSLISGYYAELRRKRAEEEEAARKAEEERLRIEQEKLEVAAKAENEGKKEEAEKILEEIPEQHRLESIKEPKMKGAYVRQRVRWKVIDEKKIPRNFMMPNGPKITEMVELAKGKIEIPGIEVYFEYETVGKGK